MFARVEEFPFHFCLEPGEAIPEDVVNEKRWQPKTREDGASYALIMTKDVSQWEAWHRGYKQAREERSSK